MRVCAQFIWMLGAFGLPTAAVDAGGVAIDADYPGGNIIVEKIEGDTVFLKPDLRDTQAGKWWFYWNFRVRHAQGGQLHFRFTDRNPIGTRGPAVSWDGGLNWFWLGAAVVRRIKDQEAWEFTHQFARAESAVRFAFAMPYQESDLRRWLGRHRDHPHLAVETLCRTRRGRAVEMLRLGKLNGEPQFRVLLTARHHACESMASYALEGLLDFILTDPTEGQAWREHVEVLAVPFMDKDGVEEGDQGKNRAPHDHNRDYAGESLYRSVAALRSRVPAWSKGKLKTALDLHCPYIRGQHNEHLYFVGTEDPENWGRVQELAEILETSQTGPLHYRAEDNLPFGKAWNTRANYQGGKSFSRWACGLPGIRRALTMEIPYANVRDQEVNAASARALGRDLARAIIQAGL